MSFASSLLKLSKSKMFKETPFQIKPKIDLSPSSS